MDVLKLSDSSFEMPLDPSWEVTYFDEDDSKADVRFNSEKYPVLGVKIISISTVRDINGLALSSRNKLLNFKGREIAKAI